MGISKAFFCDSGNQLFRKRGFNLDDVDIDLIRQQLGEIEGNETYYHVDDLADSLKDLKSILKKNKIFYLVRISELDKRVVFLGLCKKFGRLDLRDEDLEFSFFISKFALVAIDNAFMVNQLIEKKRMERELEIAKQIQLGLMPQEIPKLKRFELSVWYQPINEVGGDYYDIFSTKNDKLPLIIADVEGKGLSAALLAASCQAVFRSLNELYFFEPDRFIAKANTLIYELTRGNRFITLFWAILDDANRSVTYVNAGHASPYLISDGDERALTKGGMLTGFTGTATYEKEIIQLEKGDILMAFTDGVPEVENQAGEEFGERAIIDFIKENRSLTAREISEKLYKHIHEFSQAKPFRDDFTLILCKAL